jgi:hypothetical protein
MERSFQTGHIPSGILKLQVNFFFLLPSSNVEIENVLSLIHKLWSKEKDLVHVDMAKNMVILKTHFSGSNCYQFHEIVKKEK